MTLPFLFRNYSKLLYEKEVIIMKKLSVNQKLETSREVRQWIKTIIVPGVAGASKAVSPPEYLKGSETPPVL